jgi:hypothetical protein
MSEWFSRLWFGGMIPDALRRRFPHARGLDVFGLNRRPRCWKCGLQFNDWFIWPPGGRYCYPCHSDHGVMIYAPGEQPAPPQEPGKENE